MDDDEGMTTTSSLEKLPSWLISQAIGKRVTGKTGKAGGTGKASAPDRLQMRQDDQRPSPQAQSPRLHSS